MVDALAISPLAISPLAISMGEPAGIGLDIIIEAWRRRHAQDQALPAFYVIAPPAAILARAAILGNAINSQTIADPADAMEVFDKALPILAIESPIEIIPGTPNSAMASIVTTSIDRAVADTLAGLASAVVTAPINKKILQDGGFPHPGHTEYLAALCRNQSTFPFQGPVMMLAAGDLRVVPLTIHMPLKDVPGALSIDLIVQKAQVVAAALTRDFGITKPRLAVAGLNPHAGEDGTLGQEEQDIIIPAISRLRNAGLDISGPFAADSLFHEDARQNYDAALCMYHDQALIPLKTVDFFGGVNVTLGLPLVRTSPDHGTALSLAGTGEANPQSMIAAIKLAAEIARNRQGVAL